MSLHQLYLDLLIGGLVLLASIVGTRVPTRIGFPSLLFFLLVGVVLGEDGLGLEFDNVELARNVCTAALAVILVEGGLTTRFADIRKVLAPAGALATVGVVVSTVVTAFGAHVLLRMDWQLALLLGAIVSSTDAAAVFSVLRVLPLPRRLAGLLEAESGFNDAPAVILVLMFSIVPFVFEPKSTAVQIVYELLAGSAIGLLCGFLGAMALRRVALPASGLYPIATFGIGLVAFAASGTVHASGFIAAYLAAVVLANSGLPHRSATRSFAEGLGWLAQIGLFVLLGLLVNPSELMDDLLPAILVGLVLLLVARPLSVVVSLIGFGVPWREQAFLSWAGLRGAVPVVLATFPIVAGVPDSYRLLNIVFVLVVVFTLVQGPSLRPVAHLLGLITREATREIQVEAAPLDVLDAELLTMKVQPASRLRNVTILELRLPDPAVVTLIIRQGNTFVPLPDTRIEPGDELMIVTTSKTRALTESRLRAVSRRGKLAYWFDEYGDVG
ncbi:Putative Na(+)/H(+) antiporter [Mycobacteroides abscessus subsp. abscessus]|uniref:potassium/proton antiporter n=1 Tax=Mycobacteroides abscessus TaxID=36809 RepID=UPI00092848FC|nr:potassium/proton antiporter [Mycobacteroides abscessus]SHW94988.1 Putative Na(+)/H(+) antiporter [Mycobacteroides abscessus subsp. abscessus]SHZ78749.1 Putative Na(+)/H(+) antiporter [Mycobacteroides abscessus subsp. abscessus]SIA20962.1 Putative Na(+)/H(+) antiporter [Mycobacteroides abscessus subsp. abscessus]SKR60327.1 Putative Na(+)/H(+) antiporter [Mycobacteroides abscessus subsp. abscessus]SKU88037.1 Putative Na(+)/H(+) antiporter [Mycobacteroides abscessus subsp. abscessus]